MDRTARPPHTQILSSRQKKGKAMEPEQTTKRGTPLSPKWDQEWITQDELVENQLGRRICGAHSPAWTPCTLGSDHVNGRCRYHGGHSGIGAPLGNRNAMIHGLYSRRLQQCGSHCPLWQTCPLPSKDVAVPILSGFGDFLIPISCEAGSDSQ